VIYLIVGLDLKTLARWHGNVQAGDVTTAERIARARAAAQGAHLVIAAAIGPYSSVVTDPGEERPSSVRARRSNGARPVPWPTARPRVTRDDSVG